jgi:hypothetical protein
MIHYRVAAAPAHGENYPVGYLFATARFGIFGKGQTEFVIDRTLSVVDPETGSKGRESDD